MEHEGYFKSSDGLDFYERCWVPDEEPKAHVVLIHGYGEHCSRYGYVGEMLNRHGLAVHTYDQRGFGKSPGRRAYIDDFDVLLSDMDTYVEHVRAHFGGKPWFLMGHSMGGLVLARYAETRQFDAKGLVFSSPFLAFSEDIPKFLLALADVLGTLTPWLPVNGVDASRLSRDPEACKAADEDPLSYHKGVRARTGQQFSVAIRKAQAEFYKIEAPVYIIHGSADKVVNPDGSRVLNEQCRSEDKTYRVYDGGYHELWNDIVKDDVIEAIARWVEARAT